MKVLVTGAGGFIGSRLCKKLISEDHEVYGIIHDKPSQTEGIQIINADLTKNDFIIPDVKFDVVFHLAAATPLVKDKKKQKRINYEGIFPLQSSRTAYNPCTGYHTYHNQIAQSDAKLKQILVRKGIILVHRYHPNTCKPYSYPYNA